MDAAQIPLRGLARTAHKRRWITVLLILLGAALRVGMLAQDVRFSPDEALYATFARRMALHGDLLLSDAPLDKPPLALAVTAVSFTVFGPSEFAARLPTVLISVLTLAVTAALARSLYRDRIGPVILLLALSPLDLAFSATAYLDPLLTFWLLAACLAASRDRWRAAGIMLVFAIATKQSALFFMPLVIAIGIACHARNSWTWRDGWRRLRRFVIPLVCGGVCLALWSMARAAPVDFWTLGAINNNPGRFIRANEIVPRLAHWLYLLRYITGFAPLLALAVAPLFSRFIPRRDKVLDRVLTTYILAMLLAYWLVAFNTYDRYLHPLGPLMLLLVARGLFVVSDIVRNRFKGAACCPPTQELRSTTPFLMMTIVCMLPFTTAALRGQLNIGGDHGQHTGIDHVAAAINALPAGSIVYDYWLGWELGYYLGEQSPARVIFQPTREALARAACEELSGTGIPDPYTSATKTREVADWAYFVGPTNEIEAWLIPLRERGAAITLLLDGPFRLYSLDCRAKTALNSGTAAPATRRSAAPTR